MAVMAGCCGTALGQTPTVKVGLWENTSTTTMEMPPAIAEKMKAAGMGAGAPQTSTTKSCVTQEMIDKGTAFQGPQRDGCTNDRKVTPTGLAFTVTCSRPGGGSSTAKGTVTFEGPEKATTEVHLEMAMPSGTMVTTIKGTSKYLGADCGDVKPYTGMKR
jgi:hypothetical protein